MALTKNQIIIGVVIGVVVVGSIIAAIVLSRSKDTAKPATTNPSATTKPSDNKEVYYADKGGDKSGTNARYQFSSKDEAESYAKKLGGTLATLEQITDAHGRGMDICWLGWASDGKIYTITQSDCHDEDTIGVYAHTLATPKAGAWVYGVKPSSSVKCTDPNVGECILTKNKEVYYADKGSDNSGTNKRYQFSSKEQAESHAKSLGGTLATLEQITDAQGRGMDICWLGWASDGKIYTITQSSHGVESVCEGGSIGVYAHTLATPMAGAWVYGFKPASSSVKCTDPNVGECILPFSTKNNKWSRN